MRRDFLGCAAGRSSILHVWHESQATSGRRDVVVCDDATMSSLPQGQKQHSDHLRWVISYYDNTWFDYRWVWINNKNNAIHFGYSDGRRLSHAESLLNTNRVLADLAGIQPGDRVLDAGCGIAGSCIWLARQRGAIVVGITPVRSQVERARRIVASRKLAHAVTIEQFDYTATPFSDSSFDVVWALESLCHTQSKAAFLSRMRTATTTGWAACCR